MSRYLFALSVALLSTWTGAVHADDRKTCLEAADRGQTLRDQGKLVDARKSFVTCAREGCPAVVANQCATWLNDATRDLPTVTFRVLGAHGGDVVGAIVSIDGSAPPSVVDGRALPIDPGVHKLTFHHEGDEDVTQDVVVRAGEKDRAITVQMGGAPTRATPLPTAAPLPAVEPPLASSHPFRFPLLSSVSLGVGAAAFITMGVLVGTTASDVDHLRSTCAGSCSTSDVSSANARIAAANVMMFMGIAGVGVAAVDLIVVNVGRKDKTEQQPLTVQAGPGSIGLRGTF